MKLKNSFHPYAAVTIVFWSLAYVLTRLTLQYFTAFSLGFLRYLIASCTLAAVAAVIKMKRPRRADIPWFAASGGIGFFVYMIAFNQGQGLVPPGVNTSIYSARYPRWKRVWESTA